MFIKKSLGLMYFLLWALGTYGLPYVSSSYAQTSLQMQVGEVRVFNLPDVARVAVGDGHVLNAVTTSEKEVIVFARHEGSSALQLWSENGTRQHYLITVLPDGSRQIQQELRSVLERIPNITISSVGDKLLLEGDELSDADRERVLLLSQRYPQLLDFTGQIGWDKMVLLDVKVVELPRSSLTELGLRWDGVSQGGVQTGLAWEQGASRLLDRPGETVLPLAYPAGSAAGYLGINAFLSARIQAMAQKGEAVILAQPQLLARSGAVAEFLAGGEVPYSTVDANGNVNTEFKPYGVSLAITPQIERNHAVRSRIEVEVSSVDSTFSASNGPALKTRRAATEFNVSSGQTLVLAGFVSREQSKSTEGIPGLQNLPILGALFQTRRIQDNNTELAIFVTPTVVDATNSDLAKRVQSSNALLAATFNQKERLNHPLLPDIKEKPDLSGAAVAWNPWQSSGSQWDTTPLVKEP